MREWLSAAIFFALTAFLFTAAGFLPHRVMLPLDLPRDSIAWKGDPNARIIVSNKLLSDAVLEFHAWDVEVRRLVASGQFPWRNPLAGDGAHLFANPESSLLFPVTWLRIALGDRGWVLYCFLKLFLAGLGMWWFARVLTDCDPRSALVAGFAYMTCGFMTVWLLSPHTNVFAMLPWLAVSVMTANAPLTIIVAAFATAGGHPETLCFGVIALAIFFAWERIRVPIAPAAIGLALCAVQLVPFAIALKGSYLVAERSHHATHVRLFAVPATVLPGYLGSPLRGEIDLSVWNENFNERSGGYAGAIALIVIASAWKRVSRRVKRGVIIGAVALVLSWIPLSIAATDRLGQVFAFFVCAVSGAALDVFEPKPRKAIAVFAAVVLIGAFVIAAPAIAVPIARRGISLLQARHYLRLASAVYEARFAGYLAGLQAVALRRIAIPAICVFVAALAKRKRVIVGALAAEMAFFAYGYNPVIRDDEIAGTPPMIREVLQRDPHRRFLIAAAPDVYPPNMGTKDGVRDIRSYDVLQSRSRIEMMQRAGYDPEARAFVAPPRLPGIRWFLTPSGLQEIAGATPQPMPQNAPPEGLVAGAAISIAALVAAITIIYRT